MLRPILLSATAIALLAGCQLQDPGGETTTREQRLAMSQNIIQSCEASRCQLLNLDGEYVEDYAQIAAFSHVTSLMTSYSEFDDLGAIDQMSQLRELHIGVTQLTDLSGLSNMPNLRLLHAQGNFNIDDFSPIGGLSNLEELALGLNDLGDAGFLRNLRSLKTLNLAGATVTSLDGLRRHPALQSLDLVDASLPDDLSVLTTIPTLREISISDWALSDAQTAVID